MTRTGLCCRRCPAPVPCPGSGLLAAAAPAAPIWPAWMAAASTPTWRGPRPITKAGRVIPITSAMDSTAASGASGSRSSGQAAAGRRAGFRVAARTRPNQARPLATPARPETGIAAYSGSWPMAAAASDSRAKSMSSQHTARTGGSVRHQETRIPPWLSGAEMSSITTSAAR